MMAKNRTDLEKNLQMGYAVSYILVLCPISVYILYLGFVRWKLQTNAQWSVSHSDFFTYNMAVMELIGCAGYVVWFVTRDDDLIIVMASFPWYAEIIFPVYTSVEQYMAVVYPITYLSLKRGKGRLWIRYSSTLIVWLLSLVKTMIMVKMLSWIAYFYILDVIEIAVLFFIMIFCSASVLVALCQPKPGNGTRADKSKQKAFFILLVIMVVLVFRFVWNLWQSILCAISNPNRGSVDDCLLFGEVVNWVNLITTLLTPVLYLQRAGKLC